MPTYEVKKELDVWSDYETIYAHTYMSLYNFISIFLEH